MTSNTEIFIERACEVQVHDYDYSRVIYKTSKTLIEIICLRCHTVFWQRPEVHLMGCGCPSCAGNEKKTHEQFLEEANIAQGGIKYEYLSVYKGYHKKMEMKCLACEDMFWQTPKSHLEGAGCLKCSWDVNRKTTEQFIKEAIAIHGNKYDYSLVEYITTTTLVKISCPIHDIFEQEPLSHVTKKAGCQDCANEIRSEKSKQPWIDQLIESNVTPEDWREYEQAARNLTERIYKENKHIINPNNFPRGNGPGNYHLDHRYSVKQGCLDGILLEIISHIANLEMVKNPGNSQKWMYCSITKEELLEATQSH